MNLNLNLNNLWQNFSTALLAGADGVGVYLDRTALTLVQLEKGLKGLRVKQVLRLERQETEELALRLQEEVVRLGLKDCPMSLAVSRDLGFLRPMSLPRAAAENLAQVVAYELDRFLPLPADRLYYDYQILAETETDVQLMLLALPRDQVEPFLTLLTQVGLRPMFLELALTATANAFAQLAGKLPAAWLLLHAEPGTFELGRFQGQVLREYRQRRSATATDLNRQLSEEIARLGEGAGNAQTLCLYGQVRDGLQVSALSETHNLNTIYPSHLAIQNLPPETESAGALPALGTALRSLGRGSQGVNLLPGAERAAVPLGRFSFSNILLLVFLGLCLVMGGSALLHKRVLLYQLNSKLAALEPDARQVERQLEESRALAKQLQNFQKMGSTPDKLKILKDLTELIPDNTWLFNLRLSRQNLDISGISKSASDLIPLLDKSGWLTKTEFASPVVTDANKQDHFKIKADYKGLGPAS
jgi:general secretion pathway protein L